MMNEKLESEKFEIGLDIKLAKELLSDKIYTSDASAFREQYVNALSHGCLAYYEKYGYTEDVYVHVTFDIAHRKVIIHDNGMGMPRDIFKGNFMSIGYSLDGTKEAKKKVNNKRSGMFGLGAISFFRIASVCSVESYSRETGEHYTFMTSNTDEAKFISNKTLDSYGTKTEILLKDRVSIPSLIKITKEIASNYPAKTILEVINSEAEQSISTYNDVDMDQVVEYKPVHTFEDYVNVSTDGKYSKLYDDDEIELYVSTVRGGGIVNAFLCRVPIEFRYSAPFSLYINFKQEKYKGVDDDGNSVLLPIPQHNRDMLTEDAIKYFEQKLDSIIDKMLFEVDIKSYEEFLESPYKWVLAGFSVDDRLNPRTRKFVDFMRQTTEYRTKDGKSEKWNQKSLLNVVTDYSNVFWLPSLNKGIFDSIQEYLDTDDLIFIKETYGLPIENAKDYRKRCKIKSATPRLTSMGLKVRDATSRTYDYNEQNMSRWPEGVYYAGDYMTQYDFRWIDISDIFPLSLLKKHRIGLVVAKNGKKVLPNIRDFFWGLVEESKKGRLWYGDEKIVLKDPDDVLLGKHWCFNDNDYHEILPIQYRNLSIYKDAKILFAPTKYLFALTIMNVGSMEGELTSWIDFMKEFPEWTKLDANTLRDARKYYNKIYVSFRNDEKDTPENKHKLVNKILEYKKQKTPPSIEDWGRLQRSIFNESVLHYEVVFPEQYKEARLKEMGYTDYIQIGDSYWHIPTNEQMVQDNTSNLRAHIIEGEPVISIGNSYNKYNAHYRAYVKNGKAVLLREIEGI